MSRERGEKKEVKSIKSLIENQGKLKDFYLLVCSHDYLSKRLNIDK